MKKTQRAWIILSATTLLLFALALLAYAVTNYLLGSVLLPEQYPILNNWLQIFDLDLSFVTAGFLAFLAGYEFLVFFGGISLVLILMAVVAFSRHKGKRTKYAVSLTIGVLAMVATAVWLLLNLSDAFKTYIYSYIVTGSIPLVGLLFAIFAMLTKAKPVAEQADQPQQKEEVHIQNDFAEQQALQNLQSIAATTPAAQPHETVQPQPAHPQPKPQPEPQKAASDPAIYTAREPETISEIVARTYGTPKQVQDDIKKKKLQKIKEMYEVGAITLYEYQQLSLRIMGED